MWKNIPYKYGSHFLQETLHLPRNTFSRNTITTLPFKVYAAPIHYNEKIRQFKVNTAPRKRIGWGPPSTPELTHPSRVAARSPIMPARGFWSPIVQAHVQLLWFGVFSIPSARNYILFGKVINQEQSSTPILF